MRGEESAYMAPLLVDGALGESAMSPSPHNSPKLGPHR